MTTTFRNRSYKIISTLPVGEMLQREGMVSQRVVEGSRGATLLLQEFANGQRRTVSAKGRVEIEFPNA